MEPGKKMTELRELREAVTEVKEAVMVLTLLRTTELKEVKVVSTGSQVEASTATEPVTMGSNVEEETNWAEAQAAIASSARVKRTVVRIVNRACDRLTNKEKEKNEVAGDGHHNKNTTQTTNLFAHQKARDQPITLLRKKQ